MWTYKIKRESGRSGTDTRGTDMMSYVIPVLLEPGLHFKLSWIVGILLSRLVFIGNPQSGWFDPKNFLNKVFLRTNPKKFGVSVFKLPLKLYE